MADWAFGISLLLMVASVGLVATKGLNFGVDFIGGQMIRATFTQSATAPVTELRETVGSLGYGDPTIQRFGAENQVSIRMKLPDGADKNPETCQCNGGENHQQLEGRPSRCTD